MKELIAKKDMFIKVDGEMMVAPSAIEALREMEVQRKEFDKQYSKVKETLLNGMEEYGIKKVDNEDLLITYIEPTERCSIDTKKLWAEYKDVAFACEKVSPVKASVRITVR